MSALASAKVKCAQQLEFIWSVIPSSKELHFFYASDLVSRGKKMNPLGILKSVLFFIRNVFFGGKRKEKKKELTVSKVT